MSILLSKIVINSISKVIKSTERFDIAIDDILNKFQDSCPIKDVLLRIVKQKNQIQSSLSNITSITSNLNKTSTTAKTLITSVDIAIKVIKSIPVPVAVAGVGIPINVITILADALDKLGDLIKSGKGTINIIPTVLKEISQSVNNITSKLQQLDILLDKCISELAISLSEDEKLELIEEIGNITAQSNLFPSEDLNIIHSNILEEKLQPNTYDPLIYKGYKITLQTNDNNPLNLLSRRVEGKKDPNEIVYNTLEGTYSYSTTLEVLVNEIKFMIDSITDYELVDQSFEGDLNFYFPFTTPGTSALEIRQLYQIINTISNYNVSNTNITTENPQSYTVTLRKYKFDIFTKKWDLIDKSLAYPQTPFELEDIINESHNSWEESVILSGGNYTIPPSNYPFSFPGEYEGEIKETYEVLESSINVNNNINLEIRRYLWNSTLSRWMLSFKKIYNSIGISGYNALLVNNIFIVGEFRILSDGRVLAETGVIPLNAYVPFGVPGFVDEIRPIPNTTYLYQFQNNEWVTYTPNLYPFNDFGENNQTVITYEELGGVLFYEIRKRVFTWDDSLYKWDKVEDLNLNISSQSFQFYLNNYINWLSLPI